MKPKQFFFRLALCIAALFAVDRFAGHWLEHYYHRLHQGEQGRLNQAIDHCLARTIILGSSRAAHHYVPGIIGGALSSSCYNAGKDKQRLPYCLALLHSLYARYSPALVILDLNPTAFNEDENGLNELSVLLPYYHTHPEIRPDIDQRNRFEWIKTQSMLYCYNSLPLKILFNSLSSHADADDSAGYVPLTVQKQLIPRLPGPLADPLPVDPALLDCFREIIALTERHHTKLVLVVSPLYYRLTPGLATIPMARAIAAERHILLLDFSQRKIFIQNGKDHFVDPDHLNDLSASIFSRMLADTLRATIPMVR